MKNTYLIGKHLNLPKPDIEIKKCCMCGGNDFGFRKKDVLSSSFMDNDCLNKSNEICIYCAACIGRGQPQNEQIRLFSFIASNEQLIKLKREEIWDNIFSPPNSLFVFGVTYSHKKHISFKAPVCFPGNQYQIQTDSERVDINTEQINTLAKIIQKWYSICKDTKQEPTWFTKNEILIGCNNFKKIEGYGIDDYFQEEAVINPFKGTSLLKLLCYALNKGQISERKTQKINVANFIELG